ncbi:MAG: hypothetical protein DMF53_03375 [Acidobacteria bacterium]|nr:MAG: hypothetical protein DMF53_03375 [Acidobacteriota bacterium]
MPPRAGAPAPRSAARPHPGESGPSLSSLGLLLGRQTPPDGIVVGLFPDCESTTGRDLAVPTVENSFQYRGDLSQTALPEILYTIDRFQVPGVIEASREGMVKLVYIKEGNVVHATSTDRADSLGSYLQRGGIISPDLYLETMRERERTNKRYGVLLIENGILSPADVYRAIRKQIEAIVWSLFYWQDGSVIYSIGELPQLDAVRIQIPMRQVILQGIKRAPDAKALVARLGRKETVLEPCYKTEQLMTSAPRVPTAPPRTPRCCTLSRSSSSSGSPGPPPLLRRRGRPGRSRSG